MDHEERDIDTGEPVEELETFAVDPEAGLLGRVRRSINRRTLAADTVDFSVMVLFESLWELLKGVFEAVPNGNDDENVEDRDGR